MYLSICGSDLLLFLLWFDSPDMCNVFFIDRDIANDRSRVDVWNSIWRLVDCHVLLFWDTSVDGLYMDLILFRNLKRNGIMTKKSWWNTQAWNINEEEFNKETWYDYWFFHWFMCRAVGGVYVWSPKREDTAADNK